jgi:uncharacterized protein
MSMIILVMRMITSELHDVLFGQVRGRILALIYSAPDQPYYVNQIAHRIEISVGTVHRELKTLNAIGLIQRSTAGNHVCYQANRIHPVFPHLYAVIARTAGIPYHLHAALLPLAPRIRYALIFGAVARADDQQECEWDKPIPGEEHRTARSIRIAAKSKIELLIVGEVSREEVGVHLVPVQAVLHRRIYFAVYSSEQFKAGRREGAGLIGKIMRGKRVLLLGEDEDFKSRV